MSGILKALGLIPSTGTKRGYLKKNNILNSGKELQSSKFHLFIHPLCLPLPFEGAGDRIFSCTCQANQYMWYI